MCKRLGAAGSGQLTKMVNQIGIAGLVEALAEGIHFAKKAGLDINAVVETISKGAAQSWQMDNRHKKRWVASGGTRRACSPGLSVDFP